jgi:hypothetical protein
MNKESDSLIVGADDARNSLHEFSHYKERFSRFIKGNPP